MKVTIKAYCKAGNQSKKGCPIYFYININGRKKIYPSGKYVEKPNYFDNSTGRVVNQRSGLKLNNLLTCSIKRFEDIVLDLQREQKPVTIDAVIKRFEDKNSDDFVAYAREKLRVERGRLATKTYNGYKGNLETIVRYDDNLKFSDINLFFLKNFDHWLKTKTENKSLNSRYQVMAFMRKYLKMAVDEGLTKSYPFSHYKLKRNVGDKDFLLETERDSLFKLFMKGELRSSLQKTLGNFLLTTHTGIAADDIEKSDVRLTFTDTHIQYTRGKTQKSIKIPLTEQAKILAEYVKAHKLDTVRSRVHKGLDEIMEIAKIPKKITYHAGRNTFAIIALMKGVNIKVVQTILGHSSVSTTERYMKIIDTFVEDEMQKLNEKKDQPVDSLRGLFYDILDKILDYDIKTIDDSQKSKIDLAILQGLENRDSKFNLHFT